MYFKSRDEEVCFMKKLWLSETVVCPICKDVELVHLHKKAKKSNCEWQCPSCGEIFRTIAMLKALPHE